MERKKEGKEREMGKDKERREELSRGVNFHNYPEKIGLYRHVDKLFGTELSV